MSNSKVQTEKDHAPTLFWHENDCPDKPTKGIPSGIWFCKNCEKCSTEDCPNLPTHSAAGQLITPWDFGSTGKRKLFCCECAQTQVGPSTAL